MDPTPPSQPLATATAEAPPPENLDDATQFPPDEMQNPQGRAMANFKAFVMAIAASDPERPLTQPLKTLIENRFHQFFHDCHTPDHPPYAAMIITALQELREEGGSSEDSISEFIKSKYDDLPRAHSTFLKLHLWKLCESGEIDVTHEKYCLLGDTITKLSLGQNTGGRSKMQKPEKKRDRPCTEGTIEEENETKETARTEMEIQVTEEHNQPAGEYNEVILEQDEDHEVEEKDEVRKVQNQTMILNDAIGHGDCEEKARQQKIHEQQQQEQEKPHQMKLVIRLRHPVHESASVANVSESLPLDHCHDQKAAFTILSPTNQQNQNEQQQPVKRRRGRPKTKPEAVANSGSLLKSSDQLQKHQARGRPPKCKPSAGQSSDQLQKHQARGRPPKCKPSAGKSSDQLQKHQARGRPPKCKPSAGQSGQQRRGRPPKLRPEANETIGLSLNPSFQHNPHLQMQQGENLVLGRTQTCKSSAGIDVEIHKSSSNSSIQVGEGHERWTQEFNHDMKVYKRLRNKGCFSNQC